MARGQSFDGFSNSAHPDTPSEFGWNGDAESNDESSNTGSTPRSCDIPGQSSHLNNAFTNTPDNRTATQKRKRIKPKRITAELDTDDDLIMDMHAKGRTDVEIAEYLAKERGREYEPKSLVSRINRIVKVQQDLKDNMLEECLTDWHEDDDDFLMKAHERAEADIQEEIKKMKECRWKLTSRYLMGFKISSRFSAKACEARFTGLMDGTAIPPPEHDANPQARFEATTARKLEKLAKDEAKRLLVKASHERTKRALEDKHRRRELKKQHEAGKPARLAARVQCSIEKARQEQEQRELKARRKKEAEERAADEDKDPRGALLVEDLKKICEKRNLPSDGTKKELLLRIVQQDRNKTILKLREEAEARYLTKFGNKEVLLHRLAVHEAADYEKNADDGNNDGDDETMSNSDEDSSDDESTTPRPNPNRGARTFDNVKEEISSEGEGADNEAPRKKRKIKAEPQEPMLHKSVSHITLRDEDLME